MPKTIKQSTQFKLLKIAFAMERISKDPDLLVGILCLKPMTGEKLAFVQDIGAAIGAKVITMPCGTTEFFDPKAEALRAERVDMADVDFADFPPSTSKRRQGSASKRRRN